MKKSVHGMLHEALYKSLDAAGVHRALPGNPSPDLKHFTSVVLGT